MNGTFYMPTYNFIKLSDPRVWSCRQWNASSTCCNGFFFGINTTIYI